MVGEFLPPHLKAELEQREDPRIHLRGLGSVGVWMAQNIKPDDSSSFNEAVEALSPLMVMVDPTSLAAKAMLANELLNSGRIT